MIETIDEDKSPNRNGIQVIGRAAAVLRALRDTPSGLSLGQIAEAVGLARSTVQRIVAALQEERLVITTGSGGIRLGPEITSLASAARSNIAEICRPFLLDLTRKTGETADLSVLRKGRMIFLDQVTGTHRLRAVSAVGDVFPLTCTANGRAVLAQMEPAEAQALAEAEWAREGRSPDWPRLELQLQRARALGYAADLDEHSDGISAFGLAFTDWFGLPHAISVPVPSPRFATVQAEVAQALKEVGREVTALFAG